MYICIVVVSDSVQGFFVCFFGVCFVLLVPWVWFGVGFLCGFFVLVVVVFVELQVLIKVRFCGDSNKSHSNFMLFGANLSVSHSHYCHFAKSSKP